METNAIMNLNNIIYQIYDASDLERLKRETLRDIRMLVPCAYASILMAADEASGRLFSDPCCVPEAFLEAEESYIEMAQEDHLLWTIRADQPIVIRESRIVSDAKRLESPIYKKCYSAYHIFDTLQLSVVYERHFLGVLTLYRTEAEGAFSDEDAFYLQMLSPHLSKMFWKLGGREADGAPAGTALSALREAYHLTNREYEILGQIFANVSDGEITERLHISPHTLKKHLQNIYRKLHVSSRWELIRYKP